MMWLPFIVGLVAIQRLAELTIAQRNTKRLLAIGAHEVGAGHYPLFILLHASWLIALLVAVPWQTELSWLLITLFVILQGLRAWVIGTLGPYWTTRIITLEDAPLVRRGPYRFVRTPIIGSSLPRSPFCRSPSAPGASHSSGQRSMRYCCTIASMSKSTPFGFAPPNSPLTSRWRRRHLPA